MGSENLLRSRSSESTQEGRLKGTGKARILKCCCYVCTEQTQALYTGTVICIIERTESERGRKEKKTEEKNKMKQEKGKREGGQREKYFSK